MNTIRGRFRTAQQLCDRTPRKYIIRTKAPLLRKVCGRQLFATGYDTMFTMFIVNPDFSITMAARQVSTYWTDL